MFSECYRWVTQTHLKRPWCWERLKQEEKGTTEDEMIGWHHQLDGREFEQAPGVGDEQGSLVWCSPWGCKESDMTEQLNWTELNSDRGLPSWLGGKEFTCQSGDTGSNPGSGRSSGEGNGNPPQYSCLRNSMDREAWSATVHAVTKVWTRLSY